MTRWSSSVIDAQSNWKDGPDDVLSISFMESIGWLVWELVVNRSQYLLALPLGVVSASSSLGVQE
jgi:hypothetical protein